MPSSPGNPLHPTERTIWACSLCGTYWPRPAEARGCCEAGALRHDVVHASALYEANVEIKRLGVEAEDQRDRLWAVDKGDRAYIRTLLADIERLRVTADELAGSAVSLSRDRDQQVALYEAAMNWFDSDEWAAFEESDEFKSAERVALNQTEVNDA